MRKTLNENPVIQVVMIGLLGVVVVFLLVTRVLGGTAEESPPADPASTVAPASGDPAAPATGDPAASATGSKGDATGSPDTTGSATAPEAGVDPAAEAAAAGGFVAGPGLPADVVKAYADGKAVVLLVLRENGIDDRKMDAIVGRLRSRGDTALFVTYAKGISRYSRIAEGVDIDRAPALIVLSPRRLTEGPLPTATVDYGFRGPESVEQAVDDVIYKGPKDLPYYPK